MPTGAVVRYDKGWGFIRPDGGGRDIFMHIGDVTGADRDAITPGEPVAYEVEQGERGPRAVRIRLTGSTQPVKFTPPPDMAGECDVLTEGELRQELETAVSAAAEGFIALAKRHGWVDG